MREILLRGKTKEDGKWVYGGIFFFNGTTFIVCEEKIGLPKVKEVEETSIGQFTNILDKNGKKIFEGDIVKHFDNSDENYDIGEIYYDTKLLMWRRTTKGSFHKSLINSYKLSSDCIYDVIGDIHNNPELLKEG